MLEKLMVWNICFHPNSPSNFYGAEVVPESEKNVLMDKNQEFLERQPISLFKID